MLTTICIKKYSHTSVNKCPVWRTRCIVSTFYRKILFTYRNDIPFGIVECALIPSESQNILKRIYVFFYLATIGLSVWNNNVKIVREQFCALYSLLFMVIRPSTSTFFFILNVLQTLLIKWNKKKYIGGIHAFYKIIVYLATMDIHIME